MEKPLTGIHKFDIIYKLLKVSISFAFHIFYRKIEVKGRKNINRDNALIFTPNHQNALMDAFAVLFSNGRDLVFMARADIFKKKKQARLLHTFKMLPIYRMRDGSEELSKNEEIFNLANIVLSHKSPICLMPEGNHGDQRRLRPLVKGTFRIALDSQEKFGEKLKVQIVPVGLDYEHYQKFNQDLLIVYGSPIEVSEYSEQYRENAPRAINKLKERLAAEIKKLMIHIDNIEYYDMYQELRSIYNGRMRNRIGVQGDSHYEKFSADKEMIRILDENLIKDPTGMSVLRNQVKELSEGVNKLNMRYWVIDKKGLRPLQTAVIMLIMVIGFPVFLFGWLINMLPWYFPQRFVRNVKDSQFHSSFKFAIALFLFPAYYAVTAVLAGLLTSPAWVPWALIVSAVASGYFALNYSFWFKKLRSSLKFRTRLSRTDPEVTNLIKLHGEIITYMNLTTEEYQKRYKPEYKRNFNVR